MRVVTLVLVTGTLALCACASGFERNGDDTEDPRTDAPIFGGNDGATGDARIIDAPGTVGDAPLETDAPTTGGVDCPNTPEYNNRALLEVLVNPNYVECLSGADCASSQCCYEAVVCVTYP